MKDERLCSLNSCMKLSALLFEALKLTPANVKSQAGPTTKALTDTQDFIDISHADPAFGKKLLVAWEGDLAEAGKDKTDFLFDKMLQPAVIAKMAPKVSSLGQSLKMLQDLHHLSMAALRKKTPVKTNQDKSVWGHVEWTRESYDMLAAEVSNMLLEGNDTSDVLERLKRRLQMSGEPLAVPDSWQQDLELDAHTIELMTRDINDKLKQGWTKEEIYSYMKNMEEIDPEIGEDRALANMKRVADAVKKRLAT